MSNTFSIEENARESKRMYAMLDSGIRARLMACPGVKDVCVGLKITGNNLIWERCFHVYVDEKKPKHQLSREELVPEVIEGIRTDVHEIGIASFAAVCEDASRHRPIRGGISISNGMEFILGGGLVSQFATLGVIGRKKGFSRCNTMGLTNWHALYVGRPNPGVTIQEGSRVFQPGSITSRDTIFDVVPDANYTDNDIGKVVDGVVNSKVDLGIFEVNRSCSNCCGVPYENVIDKLETISPLHFNGITGSGRAHTGDTVYYVGSKSGPSKGTVIADGAPKAVPPYPNSLIADPRVAPNPSGTTTLNFTGQLKIQTDGTHPCNTVVPPPAGYTGPPYSRFVDHGDSGALLVNGQNQAVGLIFSTDDTPPTAAPFTLFGYANHFDDVIAALEGLGITFEINYTQPSSGGSRGNTINNFIEPDSEVFLEWKRRLEAHPKSRSVYDAYNNNKEEVLMLINHCRPVTVTWHRGKGPAYAAVMANNIQEGKFEYPSVINGITNEQLLRRLYDALMENGSSRLKEDLRLLGHDLIAAVAAGNTFEDLMGSLTGTASSTIPHP